MVTRIYSTIHELKCVNPFFADVRDGRKTAEVRKLDRDYQVGDAIMLREYEKDKYTGHAVLVWITSIVTDFPGLEKGYAMIAIQRNLIFPFEGLRSLGGSANLKSGNQT